MSKKYNLTKSLLTEDIIKICRQGINKLPSEAYLCKKYEISRSTLRKVTDELVNDGILERVQGSGCYLTKQGQKLAHQTVALILCSDTDYIYPTLIHSIKNSLSKKGFDVNVYVTDSNPETEKNILKELLLNRVTLILTEAIDLRPTPNIGLFDKLSNAQNIPIIFIGPSYRNMTSYTAIVGDDYLAGVRMVEYIQNQRISELSFCFREDDERTLNKYSGIISAANLHNISINTDNALWYSGDLLSSLRKKTDTDFLKDYILYKIGTCKCIIFDNDEIAYWFIKSCNELSISLKNRPFVASFDGTYLCDFSNIKFPSLKFDFDAYAECISECITGVLNNNAYVMTQNTLPFLYSRGIIFG